MEFIKKIFSHFFFICISLGCAGELSQGTLENGMRYYIWPGDSRKVTIALAIKKPKELSEFRLGPFFWEAPNFRETPLRSTGRTFMEEDEIFCFATITDNEGIEQDLLSFFSEHIKLENYPDGYIQNLREYYNIDYEDYETAEEENAEWERLIFPHDYKKINTIFSQNNDQIIAALYSLFEPSQMALIITGNFDPTGLKKKLNTMFGEIKCTNNGYTYPEKFSRRAPLLVVTDNKTFIDEEDEQDHLNIRPIFLYFYQFDPIFKNHVLHDLLHCYASDIRNNDFTCPLFDATCHFRNQIFAQLERLGDLYTYEQVDLSQIDEERFNAAATKLKEIYKQNKHTRTERCLNHFQSGISAKLKPKHKNLFRELETITFEEFRLFVETHITNDSVINLYTR